MDERDPLLLELDEIGRLDDESATVKGVANDVCGPVCPVDAVPAPSMGVSAGEEPPAKPTRVPRRVTPSRKHAEPVLQQPGSEWFTRDDAGADVLALSVREVGCFYMRPEGFKRWRCFNRLLGHQHVTYGSLEEVDEQLVKQTEAWEKKYADSGGFNKWSWRNHIFTGTKGSSQSSA